MCNLDNCCEAGSYNTGIAVARSTGDVFVTNECPTGKVLRFDSTGAPVGSPINIGTFPSGINVSCILAFALLSTCSTATLMFAIVHTCTSLLKSHRVPAIGPATLPQQRHK